VLVIEHPVRVGWTLGGAGASMTPSETTAAWYRFRVTVAPKTTNTFTVEETRPGLSQMSIDALTDDQVTLLVRGQSIPAALEAALRDVVSRKAAIARINADIQTRESEVETITHDQDRVRQNMRALKGTAEEKQLLQRYVRQLNDEETRLDALKKELVTLQSQRDKAQADLAAFIAGLSG
jgi:predicted RNase H-like nuclease (RuvC/YqgF family)